VAANLQTRYLGLALRNPVVVSASPMTAQVHNVLRLEQAGAGAVVLPSLFQEQIDGEGSASDLYHGNATWSSDYTTVHLPSLDNYNTGPDGYLRHIDNAKKSVVIPIIASLNGCRSGSWCRFARLAQAAGADAIELNIYSIPVDPDASAQQIEDQYVDLVAAMCSEISIPLAAKLGPFFTSLPNLARRIAKAGATGLVLFNRFLQPDVDPTTMEVSTKLVLSHRDELRLPLRWIAILRGQMNVSLAGTSGVQSAEDVIKLLLAGADVAMLASILLREGPEYLHRILADLEQWMESRGYRSIEQFRGLLSQQRLLDPSIYERANYLEAVTSFMGDKGE
jgi:dihydroorotate dehydrogenase (fumarate)